MLLVCFLWEACDSILHNKLFDKNHLMFFLVIDLLDAVCGNAMPFSFYPLALVLVYDAQLS